jgi:hypothetical protein
MSDKEKLIPVGCPKGYSGWIIEVGDEPCEGLDPRGTESSAYAICRICQVPIDPIQGRWVRVIDQPYDSIKSEKIYPKRK